MPQSTHPNLPRLLLPASSDLPIAHQQNSDGAQGSSFDAEFRRLNSLLNSGETLPDADSIRSELARLAASVKSATGYVDDHAFNGLELRNNLSVMLGDVDNERRRLEEFAIYDEYFGVSRSLAYSREDLAANVKETVSRLFDDLVHSLLNMDDVAALVHASQVMLRDSDGAGETYQDLPGVAVGVNFEGTYMGDPEYRWRLGHHFFALAAEFSRHYLITATGRLSDAPPDEIADLINLARHSLRGTTAAMWHASNMSQSVYMERVRPSMEDVQPGGFAGTQNLDYERLKNARTAAIAKACEIYGSSLDNFPPAVREAFIAHCEAEIEDLEHHTLIAASKVNMNPSLLHKGGAAFPAVEMLRVMARGRREELDMFLDA
ncbi:hypothetical protein ACFYP6_21945 [Streptomyces goshikiensis]|uniref:hypothetical protein n=1 Tax=Streptomyces goshikiensis TaxID=1942 RepID=UPI0036CA399F